MPNKLKTKEEIISIVNNLKSQGKTIVTTNGSFDILHPAHVNLLEKAKSEGDTLIVLLNSDSSIKRFKGKTRPIQNEFDRATILSALDSVDYVMLFDEDSPLSSLESIKPNKHVKGGTFIPERIANEKSLLEQWGGEFKALPVEPGYSTTNIIDKILRG